MVFVRYPSFSTSLITTDPGLQLSRMTAPANNGFPTTTFGNDGYFALVVIPEGWRPADFRAFPLLHFFRLKLP